MRKLLIVLLSIGLFTCVGCAKEEQEVELPVQKVPVVKQVPVMDGHKKEDSQEVKKVDKPVIRTEDQKITNKIIYGNEEGESNLKETKPIKIKGFK